jgi:hypothetical protein
MVNKNVKIQFQLQIKQPDTDLWVNDEVFGADSFRDASHYVGTCQKLYNAEIKGDEAGVQVRCVPIQKAGA